MKITLPTLSTGGTLSLDKAIIHRLMFYFSFMPKQSSFFEVASWRWLVNEYRDVDILCEQVNNTLTVMFERYFDHVEVDANYEATEDNFYLVNIDIVVKNNGVTTRFKEELNYYV